MVNAAMAMAAGRAFKGNFKPVQSKHLVAQGGDKRVWVYDWKRGPGTKSVDELRTEASELKLFHFAITMDDLEHAIDTHGPSSITSHEYMQLKLYEAGLSDCAI